jgi:replicative DNA helicase
MLEITREGQIVDERMLSQRTGIPLQQILPIKTPDILTTNWAFYDLQIRQACQIRRWKKLANDIQNSVGETPQELAAKMQKAIDDMNNQEDGFEITPIQETVNSSIELIEKRMKDGQKCIGIPSGLKGLDNAFSGFQPRRLYYIGARPSQGKTALLLNFVRNCNVACGILSAESAKEELVIRLMASKSEIDSQRLVVGLLREGEMNSLTQAASELYSSKGIYIYDEPNMSIDTAVMMARQMKRRFDIKILYVDYLQCLGPSRADRSQERRDQVAYASKQLKQLARVLDIPVVAAAQLRRDAEGNRPLLSDFSDSTQIERDADVAVMIYNLDRGNDSQDTWLLVEKNRDGRTGDVPVVFNRAHMRFYDKQLS